MLSVLKKLLLNVYLIYERKKSETVNLRSEKLCMENKKCSISFWALKT